MMHSSKAKDFCVPSEHTPTDLATLYEPLPKQLISVLVRRTQPDGASSRARWARSC